MPVNENIYSNKNEWVTHMFDYIKTPSYGTIKDGVLQNFIEKNKELDNSICTVLADKDFSGGYISYIRGNGNDNFDEKYVIRNIYGVNNRKIYLFAPDIYNPSIEEINVDNFENCIFSPVESYTDNLTVGKPILTYGDNSNIKLVPYVLCATNFQNKLNYFIDLDEWYNNYSETHKLIFGVVAVAFFNENGTYTASPYLYQSITNGFLNFNTQEYAFYNGTNLVKNSYFYKLNRNFYKDYNFKFDSVTTSRNNVFPIFLNCDYYNNDIRRMFSPNANIYTPVVGYFPDISKSGLVGDYTENGVGIFTDYQSAGSAKTVCRFLNVTNDYWGADDTAKINNFYEWCKKQTAYYGMFFTTSFNKLQEPLDSEYTFLGVVDENGITHGDYTTGAENKNQKNYSGDIINIVKKDIPFDKTENDKGDLASNVSSFKYYSPNKLFVLNQLSLSDLFTFINIGYRPSQENFMLDFKGKNPIDYIVSLNIFPFDIQSPYTANLSIGGINVKKAPFLENSDNVTVKEIVLNSDFTQSIFDFGTIPIKPYFNDFRDYEPFTKCELQLPYCGSYNVDLKKFMGKNVSVKYVVDYNTGGCSSLIFLNSLLVDVVDGQIGYPIPLSGIAQGDYQNTIQRNSYNAKMAGYDIVKSGINNVSNALTGNLKGLANSTVNSLSAIETGLQANYELTHTAPQPTILSTADTLNSFCQDSRARLVYYRCSTPYYDEEIFRKTVGYACIKSGKVSDFSGLMICSNIKLNNINCTDTEKDILKNLLTSGVYN